MPNLYTTTIKYYRLAIAKFLPLLKIRRDKITDKEVKKRLNELIEMYADVATKIDSHNLNLEDPNKFYDNEPNEININLTDKNIEHFTRLSLRLLEEWKCEKENIENKEYLTDQNKKNSMSSKN